MNKISFICLILAMSLSGCKTPPIVKIEKAEKSVEKIEHQIWEAQKDQEKQASEMIYATDLALDKAEDSKPVELAREFNDRAQTLVGPPTPAEAAELRRLVGDLLSQMDQERERGIKALKILDARLAQVAAEKEKFKKELKQTEQKLQAVNQENALMAEQEAQRQANWWNPFYDLKRSFLKFLGWGLVVLALFMLLPVLVALFPVLAPAVASLGSVVGSMIGWLVKMIPGAISGAGLVSRKLFEMVDGTKDKIVDAVESWQQEQKLTGRVDYKNLAKHLAEVLDVEQKVEITKTKQKIGW